MENIDNSQQISEQKKLIVSFSSSMFHSNCLGLINFKEIIQEYIDDKIISLKDKIDNKIVRPYYINSNGSPIIFADECDKDVGILKIDAYTQAYSKYLGDCDEGEIKLILQGRYVEILKLYALISGFSELEINLMHHFKDFNNGLRFKPKYEKGVNIIKSYIDENYIFHRTKKSIKANEEYYKVKGGYYTITANSYRLSYMFYADGSSKCFVRTDDDFDIFKARY